MGGDASTLVHVWIRQHSQSRSVQPRPIGAYSGPVIIGSAGESGTAAAHTQKLLDFCARKNTLPKTETTRMDEINVAFERMERSDVRYHFVIDMASLTE